MRRLYEKYRPKRLADVVGQDKAVKTIQRLEKYGGLGGNAFYVAGNSGIGKTTIARIIAGMVAGDMKDAQIWEFDSGRQLTPNGLKAITDQFIYIPQWGSGYAVIVNESHGLTKPMIEILLGVLENLPDNVVFVFTTTRAGNELFEENLDSGPFASRCIQIPLTNQGLKPKFAAYAKQIAMAEDLDGQPIAAYERLVQTNGNNLRSVLNAIQQGAMTTE